MLRILSFTIALILLSRLAFAAHNVELPIQLTSGTTVLNNHTARIVLDSSTPDFNWSYNCNDITVVDSLSNPLNFFIQTCDVVAQKAIVWVNVPLIPVSPSSIEITFRYNDSTASSVSNASSTFLDKGFLYHTQPYNNPVPGPESRAQGDAIFNYNTITTAAGYGCTQLSNANVDNSGVFGSNANIAYRLHTVLNVLVADTYEFRYGSDFGHGGELALDGTPIEADWANDLWWGFNYAHPDVLIGSVSLTNQAYTLDALGFELCCDGAAGLQYRRVPSGAWTNLTTASTDLELLAPDCPYEKYQPLIDEHRTAVELSISKTASNLSPSIGDTLTFSLTITNNGIFDAIDFTVSDAIPAGFTSVANISHSGSLIGSNLEWTIPSLAAGANMVLTFDAVVQ